MSPSHLTLTCHGCRSELRFPVSFAGRSAPCPQCGVTLTAPRPPAPSNRPALSTMPGPFQAPSNVPSQDPGGLQPRFQSSPQDHPANPPENHPTLQEKNSPEPARPTTSSPLSDETSKGTVAPPRFQAKQAVPFSDPPSDSRHEGNEPSSGKTRARWPKVLLVAGCFLLLIGTVAGVVYFQKELLALASERDNPPETVPPPVASITPAPTVKPDPGPPPAPEPVPDLETPVPATDPAEPREDPAPVNEDLKIDPADLRRPGEIPNDPLVSAPAPTDPGSIQDASDILKQFLSARTLEERQPLILESRRSVEELQAGPLAKPLPSLLGLKPEQIRVQEKDGLEEFFFMVAFEDETSPNKPLMLLVQLAQWGKSELPKINADAFLDLFENVPEATALEPFDGPRTIMTLASQTAYCFEETIPNSGRKATVRMHRMPFDRNQKSAETLAQAVVTRDSDLYRKLAEAIPVGTSVPCTLTFSWNMTEDPQRPYLELVRWVSDGWTG